jgi:hypothetical protein
MDNNLKPCPFCGSDAELITKHKALAYFIECSNTMCTASERADTAEEVFTSWNTRPIEDALRAEINALNTLYRNSQDDYAVLSGDRDKLRTEVDQLKGDLLRLTELFEDVVNQACHTPDGLEDYRISAYEDALDYLIEKGRVTDEVHPQWIAKTEEAK